MAGRKALAITERQFEVLRILWEHGPQTVRGLMEHLPRGDRQPYTTVLGLVQGMEKAGLVDHDKQGLTHLYRPAVSKQEATGSLLSDFLSRFFRGSAEQLVMGLVDAEQLAAGDLREIEARIRAAEEARGPARPASRKGRKAP
ncbi:BlaI/MecI/CopY family transcriptional regulator [Aquisphaera insulae]|uniref:BlaI/MecI/CopY family transcriptional regulator n=1 Tax=Aquisphaera insulae TaxID=2712864 RepID=UPI0013EE30DA|nr:BlaI/MecI/CopY family transcriptional regulator [Aquisphaera insulae]